MTRRLVIIGNGMAGARLARAMAATDWQVTVVGAEPEPAYNRIMLSPLLAGQVDRPGIALDWSDQAATMLGCSVTAIDRTARRVTLSDGDSLAYDRLVIATGSAAIRLPIPGADHQAVMTFRDMADVTRLAAAGDRGGRAIVIGGGLLGLEAAAGLAGRGMQVTVVHLAPWLMERQLDAGAGRMLADMLRRRGIAIETSAQSRAITDLDGGIGLHLADGRVLPADLVVMAIGVRPETTLARAAGLDVGRGIVVDDGMATSDPAIAAIGECTEHRGTTVGLVAPIWDQVETIAARLRGDHTAIYAPRPVATALKVSGIDLFSAGTIDEAAGSEAIHFVDPGAGLYRRLLVAGGRLVGAVLLGDIQDGPWLHRLIEDGTDITAARADLIFGRAHAEPALGAAAEPVVLKGAA